MDNLVNKIVSLFNDYQYIREGAPEDFVDLRDEVDFPEFREELRKLLKAHRKQLQQKKGQ